MKNVKIFTTLIFAFIFNSCLNNPVEPISTAYHNYIGWVFINDSLGEPISNKSNVSVTLIELGLKTVTDSNGHFFFNNLKSGKYNFKYEYKDYPTYYFQELIENELDGSTIFSNGSHISPKSIWTFSLDSTSYGIVYSTGRKTPDPTLMIHFTRTSPVLTRFSNFLIITGKSANNLDYTKNHFTSIDGYSSVSIFYTLEQKKQYTFNYELLKEIGYQIGDSIFIKIYSINSNSYYLDKYTGDRVYPSVGYGSNIISAIIK
jgi:hypothetical protein